MSERAFASFSPIQVLGKQGRPDSCKEEGGLFSIRQYCLESHMLIGTSHSAAFDCIVTSVLPSKRHQHGLPRLDYLSAVSSLPRL